MTPQELKEKQKQYQAAYRAKNPNKGKESGKKYRAENAEKIAAYSQQYYREHKEKYTEYARNSRAKNPEKYAESAKLYYEANKDRLREYGRKWYQDNTRVEQEALLTSAAAGRPRADFCDICEGFDEKRNHGYRTVYEHDHATGKFRGWTCSSCNSILGFAKDNPNVLLKIIEYLGKHGYTLDGCKNPTEAEVTKCIESLKDT